MMKTIFLAVVATLIVSAGIAVADQRKPNPWQQPEVAAEAVWTGAQWRIDLTWVEPDGDLRADDDVAALPREAADADLWEAAKATATLAGLPVPKHFRVARRR